MLPMPTVSDSESFKNTAGNGLKHYKTNHYFLHLVFSELAINIEHNIAINGHNEFRNATAPKTQKH